MWNPQFEFEGTGRGLHPTFHNYSSEACSRKTRRGYVRKSPETLRSIQQAAIISAFRNCVIFLVQQHPVDDSDGRFFEMGHRSKTRGSTQVFPPDRNSNNSSVFYENSRKWDPH